MKNKVFLIAFIAVIAVVIGCLIVGVISRGDRKEPSDTPITDPSTETDIGDITDIPPIIDDKKDDSENKPGEVNIDVVEAGKEYEKSPDPEVAGEVVIIPGMKGDNE